MKKLLCILGLLVLVGVGCNEIKDEKGALIKIEVITLPAAWEERNCPTKNIEWYEKKAVFVEEDFKGSMRYPLAYTDDDFIEWVNNFRKSIICKPSN